MCVNEVFASVLSLWIRLLFSCHFLFAIWLVSFIFISVTSYQLFLLMCIFEFWLPDKICLYIYYFSECLKLCIFFYFQTPGGKKSGKKGQEECENEKNNAQRGTISEAQNADVEEEDDEDVGVDLEEDPVMSPPTEHQKSPSTDQCQADQEMKDESKRKSLRACKKIETKMPFSVQIKPCSFTFVRKKIPFVISVYLLPMLFIGHPSCICFDVIFYFLNFCLCHFF